MKLDKETEFKKIDLELEKIKFLQKENNTKYFLQSLGLFTSITVLGLATLFSLGKDRFVPIFMYFVVGIAILFLLLSSLTITLHDKEIKKMANKISNYELDTSLRARLEQLSGKLNKKD